MRNLNYNQQKEIIQKFILKNLNEAGFKKVIIGLSGGIDSAVSAALCVHTLGKENVIGVMMPYKNSHPDSLNDAKLLADFLNIEYHIVPITDTTDAYFNKFEPNADRLRRGNFMARQRMCVLYDLSSKFNALVVGTTNKSELYIGYCTQFGDSACAFEPIAHLYKIEVKEMAKFLEIPTKIIEKTPTADLWEGQSDEEELGISYAELDRILHHHLENKDAKIDVAEDVYNSVIKKVNQCYFKRVMPGKLVES